MTISLNMQKINRKIPGRLLPPPQTENDGKIVILSTKSVPELLELRDRQLKLLNNKHFISKLPDKGLKIQGFYNKILDELKSKQEESKTCELLERLNINASNMQDLEWKGKKESCNATILDSDDDSEPEDVIHILSQNTSTEKIVKVIQSDKPLITNNDLEEIPHIKYIVDRTETKCNKTQVGGHFKPYKTTVSNVHNPEKEILRKKHKNWEVTAATPPPIVHSPAIILGLEESLKLQKNHNIHVKKVEALHAAEKLLDKTGIKMIPLPNDVVGFGNYRDVDSEHSEQSDAEGSDKEVHDEEPEKGGVLFTVMK